MEEKSFLIHLLLLQRIDHSPILAEMTRVESEPCQCQSQWRSKDKQKVFSNTKWHLVDRRWRVSLPDPGPISRSVSDG